MKAFSLVEALVVLAILFILVGLVFGSKRKPPVGFNGELNEKTYTAVIEGCQYLVVRGGIGDSRYFSMTHKGNCTNH